MSMGYLTVFLFGCSFIASKTTEEEPSNILGSTDMTLDYTQVEIVHTRTLRIRNNWSIQIQTANNGHKALF